MYNYTELSITIEYNYSVLNYSSDNTGEYLDRITFCTTLSRMICINTNRHLFVF